MNDSIERPSVAIRRTVGFKLMIASLIILAWILLNRLTGVGAESFGLQLFPHIVAGGETVRLGIEEFSGRPFTPTDVRTGIALAVSQVAMFTALPLLYLWLQERRRRRNVEGKMRNPFLIAAVVLVAASGMFYPTILAGLFYASSSVLSEMRKSNDLSMFENTAQDSNAIAAFRLREFAVRSVDAGGGGGTFTKAGGAVTLSDVGIDEQNSLGRFVLVPQRSDTAMQLFFFGTRPVGTVMLETTISPSVQRTKVLR